MEPGLKNNDKTSVFQPSRAPVKNKTEERNRKAIARKSRRESVRRRKKDGFTELFDLKAKKC